MCQRQEAQPGEWPPAAVWASLLMLLLLPPTAWPQLLLLLLLTTICSNLKSSQLKLTQSQINSNQLSPAGIGCLASDNNWPGWPRFSSELFWFLGRPSDSILTWVELLCFFWGPDSSFSSFAPELALLRDSRSSLVRSHSIQT